MIQNLSAAVEALLFAAGEPVEIEKLAEALEVTPEKVIESAEALAEDYDKRMHGLKIVKTDNAYQMCSAQEYALNIRKLLEIKRNQPLSQAAFEVLAVIAYNQPVTKAFIEQVRGVDCSGVVSSLCQKELIEEKGRLDLPGRPLLYGTTQSFLRCFMLESLEDLPEIPEDELVKNEQDDNQISLEEAVAASEQVQNETARQEETESQDNEQLVGAVK